MKFKENIRIIKFALKEIIEVDIKYYILGIVFLLFGVIDPLYNILPSKIIIDMLSKEFSVFNCFIFLLAMLIVAGVTNICAQWYRNKYLPVFNTKFQQAMREKVFTKTFNTYYGNFDNPSFYDKYKMALNQMDGGVLSIISLLFTTLSQILSIFLVGTIVFVTNPVLVAIVIVQVILTVILNFKQGSINYSYDKENVPIERRKQYVGRTLFLQEFIKDLKIFNFLGLLFDWQKVCYGENRKIIKKYSVIRIILSFALTFLNLFVRLIMYFYLAWSVYKGHNSLGDLTAMLAATMSLSSLLQGVVSVFPQLEKQCRYLKDLYYYLYPISDDNQNARNNLINFKNQIEFSNVTFAYPGSQENVLKGISFSIKRGERIAIVGENGAGKSTLLSIIMGLYKPSAGNVVIDSSVLDNNTPFSLGNLGCILQNNRPYAFTIAENILLRKVNGEEDINLVNEALHYAGLFEKIESLPKGIFTSLSTEFEPDGVNFSGGEIQKLALARVYASHKDIWVFDEPSSNLDPLAEYDFYKKMYSAPPDKTIIYISHKMKMASKADKIYFLHNGQFVECGTHDELMKKKGHYYNYYSVQHEEVV